MPRDLEQLLRDTAVEPSEPVDPASLMARGRRRRRLRHAAAAGSLAAVLLVAALAVGPFVVPDPGPVIDDPPVETIEPEEPSQTSADAARDGVFAEIAALPFDLRVNLVSPATPESTTRIVTDEGVWVVSSTRLADDYDGESVLGDPDGVYGRDFVHLSSYTEILLLDETETRILRAFPMPPYPAPRALAVNDDALYCHRAGDGGEPDSMLCRIDRTSFDWFVRIFSQPDSSAYDEPDVYVPDHWVIDEPVDGPLVGQLVADADSLRLVSDDRVYVFDQTTLELSDIATTRTCVGDPSRVAAVATHGQFAWGGDLVAVCVDGRSDRLTSTPTNEAEENHAVTFHPSGERLVFERRRGGEDPVLVEIDLRDGRATTLTPGMLPAYGPDGTLAWGRDLLGGRPDPRLYVGLDPELEIDVPVTDAPDNVPLIDELTWTPDGDLIFTSLWAGTTWGVPLSHGDTRPVELTTPGNVTYAALVAGDTPGRLATVRITYRGVFDYDLVMGTVAHTLEPGNFVVSGFQELVDIGELAQSESDAPPWLVVSPAGQTDIVQDDGRWMWKSGGQPAWIVSGTAGVGHWIVRADQSTERLEPENEPAPNSGLIWVNPGVDP